MFTYLVQLIYLVDISTQMNQCTVSDKPPINVR